MDEKKRQRIVKMTPRRLNFIKYYNGNAAAAARKAGYSRKTAYSIGQSILKIPEIREAIAKRAKIADDKEVMDKLERRRFWSRMARDEFLEPSARLKATELLGKCEGDFIEQLRISAAPDGLMDYTPDQLAEIAAGQYPPELIEMKSENKDKEKEEKTEIVEAEEIKEDDKPDDRP